MLGGDVLGKVKSAMTPQRIMIILAILIVIGFGIYYYYNHISTGKTGGFDDKSRLNPETGEEETKDAEIILFYVDWCPHCKTAKPEWDSAMQELDGKVINGYNVSFAEVNCTDETAEVQDMTERYNIEGYPTIKLVVGDEVIDFEAKPTKDTITQFLNTALA
jgi:thiol-disulfide isomerase/thioredoxin